MASRAAAPYRAPRRYRQRHRPHPLFFVSAGRDFLDRFKAKQARMGPVVARDKAPFQPPLPIGPIQKTNHKKPGPEEETSAYASHENP